MPTAVQVAQFRAANAALTRQVEARLDAYYDRLDWTNPSRAINGLLNFIPLLVQQYGDVAAMIAADWYEELRGDAMQQGVISLLSRATSYQVVTADAISTAISQQSIESAVPLLDTAGPEAFLNRLKGNATRHVLQPGRDTITQNSGRDRAARGWGRFTRVGSCDFCAALSRRGGVYTEASSRFASHDNCHCVTAPVFDPRAPKVDVEAQHIASAKTSSMSAEERQVFRERTAAWAAGAADQRAPHEVYTD